MNADFLSAAGPPGSAGAIRIAGAAKDAKTWQQQLQRAQAAGWFCRSDRLATAEGSPVAPSFNGCGQAPVGSARVHAASVAKPAAASNAPLAPALAGNRIAQAGQPGFATGSSFDAALSATPARSPDAIAAWCGAHLPDPLLARGGDLQETSSMEARSVSSPARSRDGQPLVRVHIEEGPQGLRLWLGVNGTPGEVAARAVALAAELRLHCARAGLRLADVTCNGMPIPGDARAQFSSRKEP